MTEILIGRPRGLDALVARWHKLADWWLAELNGLIPLKWRVWLDGETAPRLLVRRNEDALTCILLWSRGTREVRLPVGSFSSMAIDAWLAELGLRRDTVSIGMVLDRDRFFLRTLKVPKAAIGALPGILDQEVLRWTPFQLEDIWHSATVDGDTSAGVLSMNHWIIRKDRAQSELIECGLEDVAFLACDDPDAGFPSVICFRKLCHRDPLWARSVVKYLAFGAIALTILSPVLIEWCQYRVALSVETSLSEARDSVQDGRSAGNPRMRLAELKADTGFLQIWEEISRILPNHTFLSEVRLANGKVTISGFSSEAAHLVRMIDGSPLFSGSVLTNAITADATEHKDRFSISFKLRSFKASVPLAQSSIGNAS
jgi:general secretion pathway protein L